VNHRIVVLAVLLSLPLTLLGAETQPNWSDPLPVDPLVFRGKLPNGMTYWIRKHTTPPEKIGAWLHVSSGSLNEDENQRGLAHLLEHMAFNGSEHFPPGSLIKYFESIGLSFGRDQNAFTGFDQTTYQIYLPDVKVATVAKGLLCLSDFAFRMSLVPEEVEKERLVVLEEIRARKGKGQRLIEKVFPILLPGSRVSERLPIGKREVVEKASVNLIRDYYRKWYRPEFSTLIMVGDANLEAAEKLVVDAFKDWKSEGPTPKEADPGIQPYTTTRAAAVTDPEQTESDWTIVNVQPLREEKTLGDYRDRLKERLGCWIVNRRLSELLQRGQAPYQSASCSVATWFNACTTIGTYASSTPLKWKETLKVLLTEVKRACEHGFNPGELDDAKRAMIAQAEQSMRTEKTWDMRAWLGRYNGLVSKGRRPMSEAQRAKCLLQTLPWITLNDVSKTFCDNYGSNGRLLLLEMPEAKDMPPPSEAAILQVAREVEEAKVAAPNVKVRIKSLLDKDPGRAMVEHDRFNDALEVQTAIFENNVKVHIREMNFKKSQVWVRITLPGGRMYETADTRSLADAAALAFSRPATRRFDSIQIRDFLVGKNVSVGGSAGADFLRIQVHGSPEDLEYGLQLAYLLLTEAKVEAAALKTWREGALDEWKERQTRVESQLSERLSLLKGGRDPRFLGWTPEMLNRVTQEAAQAFLDRHLKEAPIEVAIVGDFSRLQALELARKYFGTLPERSRRDKQLDKLRKLKLPREPLEETVEVNTITDRAIVALGWRGADWTEVRDRRRLQIASRILQARLRDEVREKRGLTYSVFATARAAEAYPGTGFFGAYSIADPKRVDENISAMREIFEAIAKEGPTEEEMATVRKQLDNQLAVMLREPSYWLGVLADLDYRGTKLSDVAALRERMLGYSAKEVHKTLRKFVRSDRYLQVVATPKATGKSKSAAQK